MTFGSLFVSRIAAGAFAGGFGRSLIRDNLIVPPLVVLAATLLAELISVLMAPAWPFTMSAAGSGCWAAK